MSSLASLGFSLGLLAFSPLPLLLPPLFSWPHSAWTLPDASGWTFPHIYSKILVNCILERSCPPFLSVMSLPVCIKLWTHSRAFLLRSLFILLWVHFCLSCDSNNGTWFFSASLWYFLDILRMYLYWKYDQSSHKETMRYCLYSPMSYFHSLSTLLVPEIAFLRPGRLLIGKDPWCQAWKHELNFQDLHDRRELPLKRCPLGLDKWLSY